MVLGVMDLGLTADSWSSSCSCCSSYSPDVLGWQVLVLLRSTYIGWIWCLLLNRMGSSDGSLICTLYSGWWSLNTSSSSCCDRLIGLNLLLLGLLFCCNNVLLIIGLLCMTCSLLMLLLILQSQITCILRIW